MQSSKQSDFQRDFERDSARNANVLSNPTTCVRAPAPRANAGAAFASAAEHEKACSSGDFECQVASRHARAATSSGQWLRSTAEQCFRAQSTPCAVFSSAVDGKRLQSERQFERRIYYIIYLFIYIRRTLGTPMECLFGWSARKTTNYLARMYKYEVSVHPTFKKNNQYGVPTITFISKFSVSLISSKCDNPIFLLTPITPHS